MIKWSNCLVYQIEWHEDTVNDFRQCAFSKDFTKTIKRKVEHIAKDIPTSLKLRSVQPIKRQDELDIDGSLYELDIASGAKVAFKVDDVKKVLTVYLVGTHNYAFSNYLIAASSRLKP
jgi:hypothetical protein